MGDLTATVDEASACAEIARLEGEIEDLRARQCLPSLAHLVANRLARIEFLRDRLAAVGA